MDENDNHLKLLSIFHWVAGGILALFSLFPLIHVAMGAFMSSGAIPDVKPDEVMPLRVVGGMFVVIGGAAFLFGQALAVCLMMVAHRLSQRRGHLFCIVIAGIECLFMPIGTVLGVFTIIVLNKPEVRAKFHDHRIV